MDSKFTKQMNVGSKRPSLNPPPPVKKRPGIKLSLGNDEDEEAKIPP